jgi:hypothetical protein
MLTDVATFDGFQRDFFCLFLANSLMGLATASDREQHSCLGLPDWGTPCREIWLSI